MRLIWYRVQAALVTILAAALALPAMPAAGSTVPGLAFAALPENTDFRGGQKLLEMTVTLRPFESRRVLGRVEAISRTTEIEEFEVSVNCVDAAGQQVGIAATSSRNHEGSDTPFPTYPIAGQLPLYASLLFTPTSAGTYTCRLFAITDNTPDFRLKAVARTALGLPATWLQISDGEESGAQWWQNPDCDSQGRQPTCTYLGGATGLQQVYVFYNDGGPVNWWLAAPDANAATARASVTLTTCYNETGSCTPSHYGCDHCGSVVTSHLEFIQLNANLGVCRVNQTGARTDTISAGAHHYTIAIALDNVPIDPHCGSRLFLLRVHVGYLSGSPVKIDGTRPGAAPETYTSAYVINSGYGSAPSVPALIGSTEAAARNAIAAAGLSVGAISHQTSTAPLGTVIGQNPGAGTPPLPGAPVDFTISDGGAIVPGVIGMAGLAAQSAITAQGLHPAVSSAMDCVDPGNVLSQSPAAGTLVASGASVHIHVDSGTPSSCRIIS